MTINCTIPMGVTTLLSSLVITCIIVYRSADCKSLYDARPDRQSFEPCECNEDKSEIRCGMGFGANERLVLVPETAIQWLFTTMTIVHDIGITT
ncbi:hypothetical protein HUG17_8565 [Dermatophagoides farinae]|uniref:Uncharacterized protein n=1 Tax=Dermatophagoides farinae TaxID=6954 RepID=A0A9D4NXY0_DERFA|nr:hypothetical protein HUG17_8565 [Dermatophagoides farinae]